MADEISIMWRGDVILTADVSYHETSLKTESSGRKLKEVNISKDMTGILEGMAVAVAAAAESDGGGGMLEGRVGVRSGVDGGPVGGAGE
jgi:hypothetical protein